MICRAAGAAAADRGHGIAGIELEGGRGCFFAGRIKAQAAARVEVVVRRFRTRQRIVRVRRASSRRGRGGRPWSCAHRRCPSRTSAQESERRVLLKSPPAPFSQRSNHAAADRRHVHGGIRAEINLAVRPVLHVVNPRPHDQVHGAFDGVPEGHPRLRGAAAEQVVPHPPIMNTGRSLCSPAYWMMLLNRQNSSLRRCSSMSISMSSYSGDPQRRQPSAERHVEQVMPAILGLSAPGRLSGQGRGLAAPRAALSKTQSQTRRRKPPL